MAKKSAEAPLFPHSWAVDDWPADVFPRRVSQARYIIRMHRDDLIKCGALKRIGRDLVVMRAGYNAWLEKHDVTDFEIAPNDHEAA